MKKFTKLLSAIMILACAFIFAGCDPEIAEILAPTDTWYNYQLNDNVLLQIIYVSKETTGTATSGSSKLSSEVTLPEGITLLITTESEDDDIISGLTSSVYVLKSFPASSSTYTDTDGEEFNFAGSQVTWGTIYNLKKSKMDKDVELPSSPYALTPQGQKKMDPLTDLSSFSWKKFLTQYLIDNL